MKKTTHRQLVYSFLLMPMPERMNLAYKLGLLEKEDAGASDGELASRFIERAKEKGILKEFRDAIEKAAKEANL